MIQVQVKEVENGKESWHTIAECHTRREAESVANEYRSSHSLTIGAAPEDDIVKFVET